MRRKNSSSEGGKKAGIGNGRQREKEGKRETPSLNLLPSENYPPSEQKGGVSGKDPIRTSQTSICEGERGGTASSVQGGLPRRIGPTHASSNRGEKLISRDEDLSEENRSGEKSRLRKKKKRRKKKKNITSSGRGEKEIQE